MLAVVGSCLDALQLGCTEVVAAESGSGVVGASRVVEYYSSIVEEPFVARNDCLEYLQVMGFDCNGYYRDTAVACSFERQGAGCVVSGTAT